MFAIPNPYKYKRPKAPERMRRLNRAEPVPKDDEGLTGEINGLGASDIEERFARALERRRLGYEFRVPTIAGRNMPGEVELDFAVYDSGQVFPIQIDGAFAHKTAGQKQEDAMKDQYLDEYLKGTGAHPVRRIPGYELETQDMADALVREIF